VKRSILLVAQFSPPSPLVAARRIGGLTKYLGAAGHSLTVLTSMASGEGPIPGARRVLRTRDLLTSRLNWRRANFQALQGSGGEPYGAPSPAAGWIVPDLSVVGWVPFALPAAARLLREEAFDCVITSSPPESVHFVGAMLRARGLPWISDMRDGWGFERSPERQREQPLLRALDDWLERGLLARADVVVGVTEPIVADLRDRLGLNALTVPNGFDPELAAPSDPAPPLRAERHSIVHTGRMGSADRSPEPVLEALQQLRRDAPAVVDTIEVVLAGPLTEAERALLESSQLGDAVRWIGSLRPEQAIELQRAADSLLLLTGGAQPGHVPGKLYEYLAAGSPILVLGDETESARLVEAAGAGIAVPREAPPVAAALERLVSGGLDGTPSKADEYAYPAIAERMGAVVEQVCAS
jgi:glycosyltransferase involved in cell wall biosynthesis